MLPREALPISHEEFKRRFTYFPETGKLRNNKTGNYIGFNKLGYIHVTMFSKTFMLHRLAWFYMTGDWLGPKQEIDHKDWDGTNNRWENLVKSDHYINARNTKRENRHGHKGVVAMKRKYKRKDGTLREYTYYAAKLVRDNIVEHVGIFKTPEEAGAAYEMAVARYQSMR